MPGSALTKESFSAASYRFQWSAARLEDVHSGEHFAPKARVVLRFRMRLKRLMRIGVNHAQHYTNNIGNMPTR